MSTSVSTPAASVTTPGSNQETAQSAFVADVKSKAKAMQRSKRQAKASNQKGEAIPPAVAAVNAASAAKEKGQRDVESLMAENLRLRQQLAAKSGTEVPATPIEDADLSARIAALEDFAKANPLAVSFSLLRAPGCEERGPIAFSDTQKKAWREAKKRIQAVNRKAAVGFRRTFVKLVDKATRDEKAGLSAKHRTASNGGVRASMAVRLPGKQGKRKKVANQKSVSRPKV